MPTNPPPREKVSAVSGDVLAEQTARLRQLFPEVFVEGKIDFDRLRATLGAAAESGPGRFSFTWAGKDDALALLQTPSRATLVSCPEESVNFETTGHAFIEGDNLEVLKLLFKPYFGRVKLIYIDPPYNTGQDFVYPDNYADPLKTYLQLTGQADAEGNLLTSNPETSGRYHSAWLSMMYPRLFLARQLLREDGVICVSIDDHEVHHLRMLMNEVFGEENFVTQIVVESNSRGRQSERFVATVHEYLVVYALDSDICRISGAELTAEQLAEFHNMDSDGRKYRLRGLRHRGNASRRQDRPHMFFPIYVNPADRTVAVEQTSSHSAAVLPRKSTGEDGRWEWGKTTVAQRLHLLEGVFIESRQEWDVYQREYLETNGDVRRRKWKSIWNEKEIDYQNARREIQELFGEAIFDFPKPTFLLRKIVAGTTSQDDLILDFFSGSSTAAHAVLALNQEDGGDRKFIMVQLPEPMDNKNYPTIAEIGKERIRRVIARLKKEADGKLDLKDRETPEDLGFKVFQLARPHIQPWVADVDRDPDAYAQKLALFDDPLVPGWTPENVLWEVALREGYGLNTRFAKKTLGNGNVVYEITDPDREPPPSFLVCLDDAVRADLSKHCELSMDRLFVCRDRALDDTAAANLALQCRLKTI